MYNITEEQIKDIAQGGGKSKIKQMFPQVFGTKLEAGKWYKHSKLPIIFCLTSYEGSAYGYGFDKEEWFDHSEEDTGLCAANWAHIEHLIPATAKEVEEAVIQEAKKQYGEDWQSVKIKEHADKGHFEWISMGLNLGKFYPGYSGMASERLCGRNGVLFYNGKWAEILPEPKVITKTEAENRLQDLTGETFKISDEVPDLTSGCCAPVNINYCCPSK